MQNAILTQSQQKKTPNSKYQQGHYLFSTLAKMSLFENWTNVIKCNNLSKILQTIHIATVANKFTNHLNISVLKHSVFIQYSTFISSVNYYADSKPAKLCDIVF